MAAAWSRLIEMGLDVRPIRSTPVLAFDPDKCLIDSKNWSIDCAPTRDIAFRTDLVAKAADELKLRVLDLTKYMCGADRCPIVIGGTLVYRDRHHLTATFARSLGNAFERELYLDARMN